MSDEKFFVCDCGSDVLALSHTWVYRTDYEEVGTVKPDGRYDFDPPSTVREGELDHQWIAYCGGCGQGVTVEWLPEGRVRLLLESQEG